MIVRYLVLSVGLLLASMGQATAGVVYVAPAVAPADTVTAPDDLREDATALLTAVREKDVDGLAKWFAPNVLTISAGLELARPRSKDTIGPFKTAASLVAQLAQNTGGDWDVPPDVDVVAFLTRMELDFIEQSLTDGRPWGRDPMVKGAICTYAFETYDQKAVGRAATALGIESSGFRSVLKEQVLRDAPTTSAKALATFTPGQLYALDYQTDTPRDWLAFHLPEGGVGFAKVGGDDLGVPYVSGLCFKQNKAGDWVVVAQAATGL
jgi:hypothetical protein